MNIPFEVFFGFIGVSAFLFILGLVKQPTIPASVVCSGMFILFIAVFADNLIMGNLVSQSSQSGSVTTYTYKSDLFPMNNYVKVFIALIGTMIMLIGGLMLRSDD